MIYLLILIIILVFCIYFLKKDIENLTNKWSSLASKNYKVREKLPNSDDTPNIIAKLELFIDEFINYLDGNNPHDKRVKRLKDRLYDIRLEESKFEPGTSSYTINKGELISMCVRHKNEDKDFHDYQTLLFVVIHELAHVASISKGHNKEFLDNFKFLLKYAVESGKYHPVDYSKNPITYCGVKVTNNPYYNESFQLV